jgi:hypothetical protein
LGGRTIAGSSTGTQDIEPPYGIIWNRWKNGRIVPFLGAGASMVGREKQAVWSHESHAFLPSGKDLSHWLAHQAKFPYTNPWELDDLAKVTSYYVDQSERGDLREALRQVLLGPFEPGPLHRLIADIPAPQVIVVTNYDTLVEQAFQEAKKPYDLVVYPADRSDYANAVLWWPHGADSPTFESPNSLGIDLAHKTVIYKMHGTVRQEGPEWDNFVITEEDYVEFLSRMISNTAIPADFAVYFRERSFLFLGYSLQDWNLRVVLKNLSRHLAFPQNTEDKGVKANLPAATAIPRSWSIQLNPSELERMLWERRNVRIYNLHLDNFVEKMREQMGG